MTDYLKHYSVWTALGQAFPYQTIDQLIDRVEGVTLDGVRKYPVSFIIRSNGGVFEAINSTHDLVYGGTDDAGGVDGSEPIDVINAAIAATSATGGNIFVAPAVYLVNKAITMMEDVELYGVLNTIGTGLGTVFKMAANCNVFEYNAASPGAEGNCSLHDFAVDGDSRGWTGDAIHFENVAIPTVKNIRVDNVLGAAVYFYNVWGAFSEALAHVAGNNCGDATNLIPTFYINGSAYTGCANLHITNIGGSYCNYIGLSLFGAEIKLNHVFFDTALTVNPLIRIDALGHGLCLNDIDLRVIPAGTNAVDNYAAESKWSNLHIEYCLGTAFSMSYANTFAVVNGATIWGQDAGHPVPVGFITQGAGCKLIVQGYGYKYTTTPSSQGAGTTLTATNEVAMP